MLAVAFVGVPLGLYLLALLYETVAAFRRLEHHSAYLSATWEITHTLLVLALTNFTWLWSDAIVAVGQAAYWGVIVAVAAFAVREILYIYLFYIARPGRHTGVGWLFASAHVAMFVGLAYAAVAALGALHARVYGVNVQLLPYMWPALIAVVALSALPIWQSYRQKK